MPGGRPTKLTSMVDVPATATDPPRRLTVAAYICELMQRTGRSAERCARAAGVNLSSVDHWLADGARAAEKRDKGHLLYPQEQRVLEFLLATRAAHATWVNDLMDLHHQVARGGLMLGKVIETVDPTNLDADGNPKVTRRVEQSRQLPNVKALEWELERLAKTEFAPRIEVTGAEGGPIAVDDRRSRVSELMGELDAYERGLADAHDRQAEQAPAGNGSAPASDT